ncbi:hypothetical protein AJ80_06172 [Polytolypa hystricis UAMH7299]|uniref:Uncharacterized protein n=1 Tax=Polytolypa hystricis (strain UAMH7299) TaxID=1447883 RepID=A0A2B7XYP7_POLH7|nr:hypothetical protein AJ80_06172 [Polytolypa hystricis UAMH7299]
MGTRHLICIFYKGRFVVAQYGQWDGYPDGQGATIFKFLVKPENIARLKEGLQFVYIPTNEELKEINEKVKKLDSEESEKGIPTSGSKSALNQIYPSLSRDAGGDILEIIAQGSEEKRIPTQLYMEFANDGLFCEWAYVVDLDDEVFEVYGGAEEKSKSASKRFHDVGDENETVPAFLKSFAFKELPATEKEFLDAFSNGEDEAEGEEDDGGEAKEEVDVEASKVGNVRSAATTG